MQYGPMQHGRAHQARSAGAYMLALLAIKKQ
jgi:hypothetical protein